jgi:predicted Zn finger-like uncharacterized protein
MEVRCNRCGTEYEFDDVLISERGTTVKCTNCGFQFKVFPPDSRVHAPERWVVRTAAGAEIVYGSLRDLQRGIAERRVGPQDWLSRGDESPRILGMIAELEPFFVAQDSAPRAPIQRTLHGVAPDRSSEASFPPSAPATVVESRSSDSLPGDSLPGEPRSSDSLPGDPLPGDSPPGDLRHGAAAPTLRTTPLPEVAPRGSDDRRRSREAETQAEASPPQRGQREYVRNESARPDIQRVNASPASRAAIAALSTTLPSAPAPPAGPLAAPTSSKRGLDFDPDDELEATGSARSRWIAAVVVIGVFLLLALTVGRRYLTRAQAPEAREPAAVTDPRVPELLAESNRLLEDGDWDAAHERLLKASALAESDGRVLSALARLEVLRTDLSWLELRLLDPNATDAIATRRREFDRRLARTQQATSAALAEAPKDPLALRAQIDWLRMKGDSPSARSRLGPISEKASDPANAYVLAALDLSEDSPVSASLIDRLRLASSAEPGGGRAQAMLVYALALANRGSEANTELAKIGANSPVSALVPSLRQFVARTARPAKAAPTLADSAAKAPAALTAAEKSGAAAEKSGAETSAAAAEKSGRRGDFRQLLVEAKQAANNGHYSVADELYLRVLELQPGNTEALTALGDIARKRKDTARAQELYERALAEDPGFAPAIRGSARLAEDREAQKRADTEPKPELPPEATTPNPSTAPTSKPELDTTDQRR